MHRLKVFHFFQMKKAFSPVPAIAGTVTLVTLASVGASNVVHAADPPPSPPPPAADCDPSKLLVRAKDLPIYYNPENKIHQPKECKEGEEYPEDALMSLVKQGRMVVWTAKKGIEDLKLKAWNFVETGQSHAMTGLNELREPENANQRYGVIGAGTVLGFLFGLRKGFFKKIFYTMVGASAAASLCYPEEAEEYFSEIRELSQEYGSIAYHFFNADVIEEVKPPDEEPDDNEPTQTKAFSSVFKFQYSLQDLINLAKDKVNFSEDDNAPSSSGAVKSVKVSAEQSLSSDILSKSGLNANKTSSTLNESGREQDNKN